MIPHGIFIRVTFGFDAAQWALLAGR